MADDSTEDEEDSGPNDYSPDTQALWAAEACRALTIILSRRFGSEFATELHNEIFARTIAYEAGCPDDRRDASSLKVLLNDPFWNKLLDGDSGHGTTGKA